MTQSEWDFRNRLVRVTERDEFDAITRLVEFIYDVFDRRIGKLVDTTSPFDVVDAVIERYVIDDAAGVASVAGGNVVLDFVDPDGDGQLKPMELTARYLHGAAVDQILAKEDLAEDLQDPERVLWHLADHDGPDTRGGKNDGPGVYCNRHCGGARPIEATFLKELGGNLSPRNYNKYSSPGMPF